MKSTTIPAQGDKSLNLALQALGLKRNTTVGKLVTTALYQIYGEELKTLQKFFSADQVREVSLETSPDKPQE